MRFCRATLTWLLVLAALTLFGPAAALASGPSAGDQQYVDPLGGSSTSQSHSSKPSSGSTSSTPQSSAPASTPAPAPASQSASAPTASSSTNPTATTATTTSTTQSAATLPRTGYDSWLAVGLGLGLLGTGLALRRQVRRH